MPKDRKDKIIFAGLIFLAFLIANFFSNDGIIERFTKNDEIIVESEDDDKAGLENNNEAVDNLEIQDKKVYISGEVNKSGVYAINEGDRLEDLVKRAGGLTDKADINSINLAMRLDDQMKIYIPNIDENQDINLENANLAIGQIEPNSTNSQNNKVNLNLASKEELMTLPNIGEKRAQAIIDYRQENRFEKIEDIKNVSGIGDKYFEAMKDLITV